MTLRLGLGQRVRVNGSDRISFRYYTLSGILCISHLYSTFRIIPVPVAYKLLCEYLCVVDEFFVFGLNF